MSQSGPLQPAGGSQASPLRLVVLAAVGVALVAVVAFALLSRREPAADVVGLWSGTPVGVAAFLGPGRANVVRLNVERVANGNLVGSMRVGTLAGRMRGTIRGPRLRVELDSGAPSPGAGATASVFDGTVNGARIDGSLTIQARGTNGATPPALTLNVVLQRAVGPAFPQSQSNAAAAGGPRSAGLRIFVPVVRAGRIGRGFSTAGNVYRARSYIYAHKGGRVTYVFSVPPGRSLRVGYGIPRGHVVNGAPLGVLVNGARLTTVAGASATFHELAPGDELLWWHEFGPGKYRLTLAADEAGVNLYGLWFDRKPSTTNRGRH